MAKERITYLDSLKGLLIIFVMVGHCNPPSIIQSFIYTFHMPAFFMLSGMFVKPLANGGIKDMVLKYTKAYLKPYYIVVIILSLMAMAYVYFLHPKHIPTFVSWALGYAGPTWFLFALFWTLVIYRVLRKWLNDIMLFLVVIFISIFSTIDIPNIGYTTIPFDIRQGLSAVIFIYFGSMLRLHWIVLQKKSNDYIIYIVIIALLAYSMMNSKMDIYFIIYPLGFTNIACSILVSGFIICKSKYIDCKVLNDIGKHTLLILCLHTIWMTLALHVHNITFVERMLLNIIPVLIITYLFVKVKGYIMARSKYSTSCE